MEVYSIRIPKELKEEMTKLDLDWGEYLRGAIEEKGKAEKMSGASRVMDELREKTKAVKFDTVKVIREARNSR